MNCVIVDDDIMSRKALEFCIDSTDYLTLVGAYSNAIEARMGIEKKQVDLIFLDVEMPEMTGIDFLRNFRNIPQVILVSAKEDYAFAGFKYDVTGYIIKPVDRKVFLKATKKALDIHNNIVNKKPEEAHVFVKVNNVLTKVYLHDLNWVEALGDYIRLHTDNEKHIVLSTMKSFQEKLPETMFMRVHKSYIANMSKVKKMANNALIFDKGEIPVSRTYKEAVVRRLGN